MRDPELLRPVLEVRPEYLQASFDTIRDLYGDVGTSLRDGLGLDDATLRAPRSRVASSRKLRRRGPTPRPRAP